MGGGASSARRHAGSPARRRRCQLAEGAAATDEPLEEWSVERVAASLECDEQLATLAPYARAHAITGSAALGLDELKLEEIIDTLPCYAVPRDVVEKIKAAASRGGREKNDEEVRRGHRVLSPAEPVTTRTSKVTLPSAGLATNLLSNTPTDSIWRCRTADERREWVERNKHKIWKSDTDGQISVDRIATVIASSEFEPVKLVALSCHELSEKLKTMDDSIVSGQKFNFIDLLRKQEGHRLYHAQHAKHQPGSNGAFGSFIFEMWLGNGISEVCKVRDRRDGKLYTLFTSEIEPPHVLSQANHEKEIEMVLSEVKSDYLLSVLEYGIEAPELFWTRVELITGGSLAVRLSPSIINGKGLVNEQVAWTWMVDCVSGLEHLHFKGIMHNDLKPEVHLRAYCTIIISLLFSLRH